MIKKFNRYELKYVVNHSDYLRLSEDLRKFMSLDSYAGGDGCYSVSSLYYDTLDYDAFRSKIDGVMFRRKLRLRVYPQHDSTHAFVEIKQRVNRTVQKRRIYLPIPDAKRLCMGDDTGIPTSDLADRRVIDEVLSIVKILRLRPSCIISYRRRAYVGCRYDIGLRITFDSNLKHRINNMDDIVSNKNSKFILSPDFYIMEIKANERVPIWLTSFLAKHQCNIARVSKYCAGLKRGLISREYKRTAI